jgi:hypothetical protein
MTRRSLMLGLSAFAPAPPLFEEVPPARSGITWAHDNAISPQRYLPESLGPGVAFLDYDSDGWLDIFLVNGGLSPLVPSAWA